MQYEIGPQGPRTGNAHLIAQHMVTCISSRVPLYHIVIDQINKLPEDGLKSSPETSLYVENTWIIQKITIKLHFIAAHRGGRNC